MKSLNQGIGLRLSVLALVLSILACGFPSLSETETPTDDGDSNASTQIAADDSGDTSTADLARATVQIFALERRGNPSIPSGPARAASSAPTD